MAIVAGLFVFDAGASAPPIANGTVWAGVANSAKGKTMHVVAGFEGDSVSMRFGEPAACRIVAAALDARADVHTYRFKVSQNGGAFCRQLYPGELTLTSLSTGSIGVRFDRGEMAWSGTLERVGDP
ncbi:hypothetical protein [Xanthomonas sp. NCPPB 2632]|uniref:hypothetical protein n=1 Tax=Xanthomonas sp. NCPPB 2632 TaxID=3240912 RepID=UPI003515F024